MIHRNRTSSIKTHNWTQHNALALAAIIAFTTIAVSAAHAQNGTAVPETAPTYTLRTGVNMVIVDVIVDSPDGKPVHNLKAGDFSLVEDGKPQSIRSFDEHSADSAVNAALPAPAPPKLAPGIFTNYQAIPAKSGPVNILLLDTLNTPLRDQTFVRSQLLDFLKKFPPGAQVAIFGLSQHLILLQGFTADPAILKAAVQSKSAAKASNLLDDQVGGGGGDGAGATAMSDSMAQFGDPREFEPIIANVQQFEAEQQTFQFQMRARLTLDAMNELARYLVNIPGRKNLLWFTGSVPIDILPNGDLGDGFRTVADSQEEFRETTNLLSRSQVSVYPIDARGLMTSPVYSAAASGSKYGLNPQTAAKDDTKFQVQTQQEQSAMQQVAQDTGGRAYVSTNGLSEAVQKAIDDGSNYYTLTYSPTGQDWDGSYRKITVALASKANRADTLSYRRGYYADDPNKLPKPGEEAQTSAAANSPITRAMMRGSPPPTQILFNTRVLPATPQAEETVAPGNQPAAAAHGPYRRLAVDFALDPRDLVFTESGGARHDTIDFLIFVYDQNGTLVNRTENALRANLTSAGYAKFLREPFAYSQDVSVPEKGSFFLRIAVHDEDSDRAGAVEIPVDMVKNLPPLHAGAAQAPAK